MATYAKRLNNIVYVEPNFEYQAGSEIGANGRMNHEAIPPTEDYCIYANLEVEVKGRRINVSDTASSTNMVLSWESTTEETKMNFMRGTKMPDGTNYLTSNYTDIFLNDIKTNGPSTEMFGINSIDISFNANMQPVVTIEFVDVRGVSLFSQREYYDTALYSSGNATGDTKNDIANTFFQCFFTVPYPKFNLLLKGFYGKPTSYQLACTDFRARFKSDTGSFNCTAKFIGYQFGFLNDVMLNALVAAPYSDYVGEEYWDSKGFEMKGINGTTAPMPKIAQLENILNTVEADVKKMSESTPEVQEKNELDAKQKTLNEVRVYYLNYISLAQSVLPVYIENTNNQVKLLVSENSTNGEWKNALIFSESGNGETYSDYFDLVSLNATYETFKESLDKYNSEYSPTLPTPTNISGLKPNVRLLSKDNDGKCKDYEYDDESEVTEELIRRAFFANINNGNKYQYNPLLNFSSVYFYKDNGFCDAIENALGEIETRYAEVNQKLSTLQETMVSSALGWDPSVENLSRIVMAHFETLAYMLFKCGYDISNEKRTVSSLGISADDASDVNLDKTENIIPPFPKVTEIKESQGSRRREEAWIGKFTGYFKEKDLVHGIINGLKQVKEEMNPPSGTTNLGEISSSPIESTMKNPITVYDLLIKSKPYDGSGIDFNNVASVLGIVALRGINIFNLTSQYDLTSSAKEVGAIEASNFMDEFNLSRDMKDKLNGVRDNLDAAIAMIKGGETEIIRKSNGKWPWSTSTNDTNGIIDNDGLLSICKNIASKNDGYLAPVSNLSWKKIISETIQSNKALLSNDYIPTKSTVVDIENGAYKKNLFTIELNVSRFSKIIDNQMSSEGLEDYKKSLKGAAEFNQNDYKSFFTNTKYITYVIDNINNIVPKKDNPVLPSSPNIVKKGVKYFGGGYSMDNFYEEDVKLEYKDGSKVKRRGGNGFAKYLEVLNANEFTITEFPSVTRSLEINFNHSLFASTLYYKQPDLYSKAYLFLTSLGGFFNYQKILSELLKNDSGRQLYNLPLPSIMYIGSLIWANENEAKLKNQGISPSNKGKTYFNTFIKDNLRQDVRYAFKDIFFKWVDGGLDWADGTVIKPFNSYVDELEIHLKDKNKSIINFLDGLGETEDNTVLWFSRNWFKQDGKYESLMDFFVGELQGNFFHNYLVVHEDVKGGGGMRLGNRDGGPGVVAAVRFALAGCSFAKHTRLFCNDDMGRDPKIQVDPSVIRNYLEGFLDKVLENYTPQGEVSSAAAKEAADPENSTDDIKIGIYRYLKLVYDKWISGLSENEFNDNYTVEKLFDADDKYFFFVDTFYNKANGVYLNIRHFVDTLYNGFNAGDGQFTLLSFLSEEYSYNKFLFTTIHNFLDITNPENIESMFDLVPITRVRNVVCHPSFVVMKIDEPSSHLDIPDSDYPDDSFLINDWNNQTKWPEPLRSKMQGIYDGYTIPSFGVTYGKMYQSYFKDVEIGMDNPMVTEQAIRAQMAIISPQNEEENSGDNSNVSYYGNDLYSVYSNNSYTCTVTMLGCGFIQPLMYFVLTNIPMFRGTYLIQKVEHSITPGNMMTKFVGVRMANTSTHQVDDFLIRKNANGNGNGGYGDNYGENSISNENLTANSDNDCPYKVFPLIEAGSGGVGGGIPESFLNMSWSDFRKSYPGWIQKDHPAAPWLLTDDCKTVKEAIVAGLGAEYQGFSQNNSLMLKISAAIVCNKYHYYKNSKKWVYVLGTGQQGTGNKAATRDMYNKVKDIVEPVLLNGPQSLVGLTTSVQKDCNVEIWNKGQRTPDGSNKYKKAPNTHVISTDDMQKVFMYCTQVGYDYEHLHGKFPNQSRAEDKNIPGNPESYWKKANFLFQEYNTVFTTNCDAPDKKYWEPQEVSKLEGNEDKHVDGIVEAFVNALSKTCEASSVGVNVGYDKAKSSKNNVWITNGNKSSNFGSVMDVILQAYGDKVETIKWVVPKSGNISQVPSAFLCTVKEGSTTNKISVVSEDDLNTSLTITVGEGQMNPQFCNSIAKKYKNNQANVTKDVVNLSSTEAEKLFETYEIKDCNTAMEEKGFSTGGLGTGGEVVNGKIGNWDVGAAITWAKRHCLNDSAHICSWATQQIVKAGGIAICHGDGYRAVLNTLREKPGSWALVLNTKSNSNEYASYQPQMGDIMGMTKGPHKNEYGHICIYGGDAWYSDFKQKSAYVYRKVGVGDIWVMRYKGEGTTTNEKPQTCKPGSKCLRQ